MYVTLIHLLYTMLGLSTLLALNAQARENEIEYEVFLESINQKLNIWLTIESPTHLDGFVLYENSEERNPLYHIPLKTLSLDRGERKKAFLITFEANLLDMPPMSIRIFLADPSDNGLNEVKNLYSIIRNNEGEIDHLEMLHSEFARRTNPWVFRSKTLEIKTNNLERQQVTVGGLIIRGEDSEALSEESPIQEYTISGFIPLDPTKRGFATIKLPKSSE
ncbi:hypothetical protein MLD52_15490 [Puniceicoccaceae bacterium K14]|nr:hypothetical protein [Puniceicoccaceae bacterium K14]